MLLTKPDVQYFVEGITPTVAALTVAFDQFGTTAAMAMQGFSDAIKALGKQSPEIERKMRRYERYRRRYARGRR